MKKGTILGATAILGAGALIAWKLFGGREESAAPESEPETERAVDPDQTLACPLKSKYVDHSRGESEPVYFFALDTPYGAKELAVTEAQYETYYIGDEVVCLETDGGLEII